MKKTGFRGRILAALLCASLALSSSAGISTGIVKAAENDSAVTDTNNGLNKSDLKINFTLIEESKLTTPVKNKYVVIDMGEEGVKFEKPELVLVKQSDGSEKKISADKVDGTSMLFYLNFPDNSSTGIYKLKSVRYTSNGTQYEKAFEEDGIVSRIGVNKDPNNTPDGYVSEKETVTAAEVSQVNGQMKELDSAVRGTNVLGVGKVSKNIGKKAVAASNNNSATGNIKGSNAPGNIIIVLDPGHGGSDPGASYVWDGVTYAEREINQKIANYCKAALEKYDGVTVYLTRTSTTQINKDDLGENDLQLRCQYAADVGADLLVSLHCNAAVSNSANGAEVYVPNANYNSRAYNVGKAVGTSIGKKLRALGLTDGATYIRNSEGGNQYADGSLADYYAMIRCSKQLGIPGMIVEHCYLSNRSDCINFLQTDAKIKKLAEADAAGIAENIGLIQQNRSGVNSTANVGWQKVNGRRVYYDKDGNIKTGFFKVSGKTYFAKSNGYVVTGWQLINGSWYFFSAKGVMAQNKWKTNSSGSTSYLTSNGKMAIGVVETVDGLSLFDNDGILQLKGWHKYNNAWYYCGSTGRVFKSRWLKYKGNMYYFRKNGKMATGFSIQKKKRYYLNKNGQRVYGWQKINKKWYYFDTDGVAKASEFMKTKKKTYYFDAKGVMATGVTRIGTDLYLFSADGVLKKGWIKDGSYWYFANVKGKLKAKCWFTKDGNKYYFDEYGRMATGTKVIDGKTYRFKKNGAFIGETKVNALHPVMSNVKYTADQLAQHFRSEGHIYPSKALKDGGAKDIKTFCTIIVEEATAEGVNPGLVYAQIMNETGWLQFGGDVKITQYNFCGMGAVGGGVPGCSFKNVRIGIRAQVQHLKAYGSTQPLKNKCVDPRFQYVERGCATYIEHLGIQENPKKKGWAAAVGYGNRLLNIMYSIK